MPARAATLAHFSALVRRCREQAGYRSARAFYDAQGGRAALGVAYKAYANLERGASAPQPALVERLAAAFRLALAPERAREFALAYLRVLLGFEGFLEFAVGALGSGGGAPRGSRGEPVRLSPAAARAAREPAAYACLCALSSDPGRWSPEELAGALGLSAADARRALAALAKAGLASKDASGRFRWPRRGRGFAFPPGSPEPAWPGGREALLFEHPVLVRAKESELRGYLPYLAQAVAAAEPGGADERGPDTGLFAVELTVNKILPF